MSSSKKNSDVGSGGGGGGRGGGGGGGGSSPAKNKKKGKNGAATTPSLKDCANCGAGENTIPGIVVHLPCSKCKITYYCSVRCQKQHWKEGGHKHNCVQKEERSVAKAEKEATKKKTTAKNAGAAAEEEICAICQYPVSDAPSKPLPCSHVYHVACVEKLRSYDIKQVCPTCRVDLPPGSEQLFEEATYRYIVLDRRYGQGGQKPWRRITNADDRRVNREMLRMTTEAAEQGHARAQCHLGTIYTRGSAAPKNDALAVKWLKKSAEQGFVNAQYNLAQKFNFGHGVLQNSSVAAMWFRKAADQGSKEAQNNLGNMYRDGGRGVPQSDEIAAEWYRKAGGQGDNDAQLSLGSFYVLGRGVPQNHALAMEWFLKAADQGDTRAMHNVAGMYNAGGIGLPQDKALALKYFREAAEHGAEMDQYILGMFYVSGEGVPQNFVEALKWLRKAHAKGYVPAARVIKSVLLRMQHEQGRGASEASLPTLPSWNHINAGTRVRLCGLQAQPELNGQRGTVTGFVAASERYTVQLDDGRGPFSLKIGNIVLTRTEAHFMKK
jgi:TPR repeat protein